MSLEDYERRWMVPASGRSVSVFRILFGILVVLDAWYFYTFLDVYWPSQNTYFQFPMFQGILYGFCSKCNHGQANLL